MEWANEYFEIKQNVCPPQRFRTRDTLMKNLKKTYSEFAGGSIETQKINVNDVSCLSHCCCLKKYLHCFEQQSLNERRTMVTT